MCQGIAQCLIVSTNIVFIVCSLVLMVLGGFMAWNPELFIKSLIPTLLGEIDDDNTRDELTKILTNVISFNSGFGLAVFLFGVFLFILPLCGICGVCCKNKVLLIIYVIVLLVITLGFIILTIFLGTQKQSMKAIAEAEFTKLIEDYEPHNSDTKVVNLPTKFVDIIQEMRKCCGTTNLSDFDERFKQAGITGQAPASCCKNVQDQTCWKAPTLVNSYMNKGCVEAIWTEFGKNFGIILIAFIVTAVVMFIVSCLTILLIWNYAKKS